MEKNKKVKIRYSEKRIKLNLGYGILMFGLGLLNIYKDSSSVFGYLLLVLGFLQFGTALREKKKQYITIEDNRLTKHSIFPKSIDICDIKKVRMLTNSYKIETSKSTLIIYKNFIETESLYKLQDFFKNLKL